MFSGIVEATARVLRAEAGEKALRLQLERPSFFNDLKVGDSIAANGICLTVENFSEDHLEFALGAETLKVLGRDRPEHFEGQFLNLERSLRWGDRIHGHLVSGHVDFTAKICRTEALGESWLIGFEVPKDHQTVIWKKGSVTVHGVSLTVNEVLATPGHPDHFEVQVCLIPETLKRTNLRSFAPGDVLNIEIDWMAKAWTASMADRLKGRLES